jgi:hypothetical protein
MAMRARQVEAPEHTTPEAGTSVPAEPESEAVPLIYFGLPGPPEGYYDLWGGTDDKEIFDEALRRCGGLGAVHDHLAAIDVLDLLGSQATRRDAWVRSQDMKMIAQALELNSSADALVVLLAGAVLHAQVREIRTVEMWQEIGLRHTCERRGREIANRIPKRRMTPACRETVGHYLRLLKKHGERRGAQIKALRELVTLPSEQGKRYVRNYLASCDHHPEGVGDIEPVRHYVKSLVRTWRKRR